MAIDESAGQLVEAEQNAIAPASAGAVAERMVSAIVEAAADPAVDVEKLERLMDLQERMLDKQAEQEYARAFAALQMELPPISETSEVPGKGNTVRFRYAKYGEIMETLRPLLRAHGFSTSRSQEMSPDGKIITEHLTVYHVGGHKSRHSFSVRAGGGSPGAKAEEASGGSGSYAARYALRDAFDLTFINSDRVTQQRESEEKLGSALLPEQAQVLMDRVTSLDFTPERERKFLRWAGVEVPDDETVLVDHYEKILDGRLPAIESELARLEMRNE